MSLLARVLIPKPEKRKMIAFLQGFSLMLIVALILLVIAQLFSPHSPEASEYGYSEIILLIVWCAAVGTSCAFPNMK